jgi:hypothetical protein
MWEGMRGCGEVCDDRVGLTSIRAYDQRSYEEIVEIHSRRIFRYLPNTVQKHLILSRMPAHLQVCSLREN